MLLFKLLLWTNVVILFSTSQVNASVALGPAWKQLGTPLENKRPLPRQDHASAYCSGIDAFIVFRGYHSVYKELKDLWVYRFESQLWQQLISDTNETDALPRSHRQSTLVVAEDYTTNDLSKCRMVLFGGNTMESDTNEVWILDIIKPTHELNELSCRWYAVELTSSEVPHERFDHASVYRKGSMYVFGGQHIEEERNMLYDDVWKFEFTEIELEPNEPDGSTMIHFTGTWEQLLKRSDNNRTPAARSGHTCTLKSGNYPHDDSMLVYGGMSYDFEQFSWTAMNDLWEYHFDTNTWSNRILGSRNLIETSYITARIHHTSVMMDDTNFMVFGGYTRMAKRDGMSIAVVYSDTLITSLGNSGKPVCNLLNTGTNENESVTWCRLLQTMSIKPSARFSHTAITRKNKMLIFGGQLERPNDELWELNFQAVKLHAEYVPTREVENRWTNSSGIQFFLIITLLMVITFLILVCTFRTSHSLRQSTRGKRRGATKETIDSLNIISYETRRKRNCKHRHAVVTDESNDTDVGVDVQDDIESTADFELHERVPPLHVDNDSCMYSSVGTLPRIQSTPKHDSIQLDDEEGDICPICLVEFEYDDQLRELPCKHMFHVDCIDTWLIQDNSCPMCKRKIVEEIQSPSILQELLSRRMAFRFSNGSSPVPSAPPQNTIAQV